MTEVSEAAPVDTEPRHQPPPPSLDNGEAAAVPRPEQPTELDSTQSSTTAPSQSHNLSTTTFDAGFYRPKEAKEKEQTDTPEGTVQLQFGQSGVRPIPLPASDSTEYPPLESPPAQLYRDGGGGKMTHGERNPGRWKKGAESKPYPNPSPRLFDTEDP